MGIAELELKDLSFDLDRLVVEVCRSKRVMRISRHAGYDYCDEDECKQLTFHVVFPLRLKSLIPFFLPFLLKTAVNSLDKSIGRPGAGSGTKPRIVVQRWFRRFHLLQRHTLVRHLFNAIANDRDHVPVVPEVRGITDAPVTGNEHRAAFGSEFGNSEIEKVVQPIQNALNGPAFFNIDHWVSVVRKNVTRSDNVGAAEINHRVAVALSRRGIDEQDTLAIEEIAELVLRQMIDVGRQRQIRNRRLYSRYPAQHCLMSKDCGTRRGITTHIAAGNGGPRTADLRITSYVLRIKGGIDDVTNRLGRLGAVVGDRRSSFCCETSRGRNRVDLNLKPLHRGKNVIGHLLRSGIHQHDTVAAHRSGDIRAGPPDQIDISLDRPDAYFEVLLQFPPLSEGRTQTGHSDQNNGGEENRMSSHYCSSCLIARWRLTVSISAGTRGTSFQRRPESCRRAGEKTMYPEFRLKLKPSASKRA